MKLGSAGIALIKSFEQCRLVAYQDQRGVWTIGWGHTGPEVVAGLQCTQAQADFWLVGDTQKATTGVMKSLDVVLGQNAFDALVSFTFNVGVGAEAHSTLLAMVNRGAISTAGAEFLKWDHVNGVENAGLARRRAAERALFLLPDVPASASSPAA